MALPYGIYNYIQASSTQAKGSSEKWVQTPRQWRQQLYHPAQNQPCVYSVRELTCPSTHRGIALNPSRTVELQAGTLWSRPESSLMESTKGVPLVPLFLGLPCSKDSPVLTQPLDSAVNMKLTLSSIPKLSVIEISNNLWKKTITFRNVNHWNMTQSTEYHLTSGLAYLVYEDEIKCLFWVIQRIHTRPRCNFHSGLCSLVWPLCPQ